ncbi:MAG: oligoendopeptidase F, partial [Alphaproteobacteria bacterium]
MSFQSRPTVPRDTAEAGSAALGALPEWDLSDLYPAPDAPELARDLDWLRGACADFAARYQGRLATLDAAGFLECIRAYERIHAVSGRIMSYAGLRYYQQTTDAERSQFLANMQDRVTEYTTPLVFFSLEVNRLDDALVDGWLAADAELARYRPVLERLRKMRPHQLSDELERFLHDMSVVGAAAWNRLFDETTAALTFEVQGETLNLEATLNTLTDT